MQGLCAVTIQLNILHDDRTETKFIAYICIYQPNSSIKNIFSNKVTAKSNTMFYIYHKDILKCSERLQRKWTKIYQTNAHTNRK